MGSLAWQMVVGARDARSRGHVGTAGEHAREQRVLDDGNRVLPFDEMRPDQPAVAQIGDRGGRVAVEPVENVERAGDHALVTDPHELAAPALFRDQQRADRRDQDADREDQRDPAGQRTQEPHQPGDQPPHSKRVVAASI